MSGVPAVQEYFSRFFSEVAIDALDLGIMQCVPSIEEDNIRGKARLNGSEVCAVLFEDGCHLLFP